MSLSEAVVAGTIQPDGTLVLDEKPRLGPGRVTVIVRQNAKANAAQPLDATFFQMMEQIWSAQVARGGAPRTEQEVEADRREVREGWEHRQQAIERLQEESRKLRQQAEAGKGSP